MCIGANYCACNAITGYTTIKHIYENIESKTRGRWCVRFGRRTWSFIVTTNAPLTEREKGIHRKAGDKKIPSSHSINKCAVRFNGSHLKHYLQHAVQFLYSEAY